MNNPLRTTCCSLRCATGVLAIQDPHRHHASRLHGPKLDMHEANRGLAGILPADVVGCSAMVGKDEPSTLARVRTLRTDIVEPLAADFGGRLFKATRTANSDPQDAGGRGA